MNAHNEIRALIEQGKDASLLVHRFLWANPELFFRETRSAAHLVQALKKEGFTVKEQVGGMPTAFIGEYGQGSPVIGILGEFDALPSLSQKAALPVQEEIIPGGPGHGCGHNALGAGAFAAASAVKAFMEKHGTRGTLRFYGCPAEEAGWSKMFLARDGYFDDLDAAVTWHPNHMNTVQGSTSLANICAYFSFSGKTAHAASAPHLGRSALDACELMSVGVNYLREHVPQEARMHYAYQDVGGDAPNVVQDRACVKYFIRAPQIRTALEVTERVKDIARGAALMTGTKVQIDVTAGMCEYVPNDALGRYFEAVLAQVGPPGFDDADRALAAQFFALYNADEKAAHMRLIAEIYPAPERFGDVALIEEIAPYKRTASTGIGSTDVGDVSYATPTVQLNIACFANGTPGHSWQLTAQSGSSIAEKGMLCAAEAMALGTVGLFDNPELLAEARKEYVAATGGKYICPVGKEARPCVNLP